VGVDTNVIRAVWDHAGRASVLSVVLRGTEASSSMTVTVAFGSISARIAIRSTFHLRCTATRGRKSKLVSK